MIPVKTNESNTVYKGPTSDIHDLHCKVAGTEISSVWQLTDVERRMIAEGGNIRLSVYARQLPPVLVQVVPDAGPYERIPAPCARCNEEIDQGAHEGSVSHAYRAGEKR